VQNARRHGVQIPVISAQYDSQSTQRFWVGSYYGTHVTDELTIHRAYKVLALLASGQIRDDALGGEQDLCGLMAEHSNQLLGTALLPQPIDILARNLQVRNLQVLPKRGQAVGTSPVGDGV
jgi:hypothetical protein